MGGLSGPRGAPVCIPWKGEPPCLAEELRSCLQDTTTTWTTPTTRAMKRRSGPTSAAWPSSRPQTDTSSEVSGVSPLLGPGLGCGHPSRLPASAETPRAPSSSSGQPGASSAQPSRPRRPWGQREPLPVVSTSFVFFPTQGWSFCNSFWLDHPTAEGGLADPEAEETPADAESAFAARRWSKRRTPSPRLALSTRYSP